MLNGRLAEHYGLPPVSGAEFRRVELPAGSIRGGLLTQASILKVTANGTNSSPVKRGAWVMERILGQTPPPPPPGVPGVEPDIRGAHNAPRTARQTPQPGQLQGLSSEDRPAGFCPGIVQPDRWLPRALPLPRRWRQSGHDGSREDRSAIDWALQVDSSGQLPDGRKFAGFTEFRDYLAEDSELLARTLAVKLLTFATGRELGFSDRAEVERIVKASAAKGNGVRDLVHLVVQSEIFRRK